MNLTSKKKTQEYILFIKCLKYPEQYYSYLLKITLTCMKVYRQTCRGMINTKPRKAVIYGRRWAVLYLN